MAEELDLHLLELARAEREVPRRDLVAKALAHLGDAERHADARAVADVLEVDEDALGRFGPQKAAPSSPRQRADDRLEHQVELARLGERAERLGVGAEHLVVMSGSILASETSGPSHSSSSASLAAQVEELQRPLLDVGFVVLFDRRS